MDADKLAKLREIAAKATPGPYHIGWIDDEHEQVEVLAPNGCEILMVTGRENESYFCTFTPEIVKAMLDVVEAAKGMKEHGSDYRNGTHANILWGALAALAEACEKKKE